MRVYTIEPHYSQHIKSFTSHEEARQKLALRKNAPIKKIADTIKKNGFPSYFDENGMIHIKTEDPVKLVKLLCDTNFIDVEQATAIIAHEIEHIRNPIMQKLLKGRRRLKEVREVVIADKIRTGKTGVRPPSVSNPAHVKDAEKGKLTK